MKRKAAVLLAAVAVLTVAPAAYANFVIDHPGCQLHTHAYWDGGTGQFFTIDHWHC